MIVHFGKMPRLIDDYHPKKFNASWRISVNMDMENGLMIIHQVVHNKMGRDERHVAYCGANRSNWRRIFMPGPNKMVMSIPFVPFMNCIPEKMSMACPFKVPMKNCCDAHWPFYKIEESVPFSRVIRHQRMESNSFRKERREIC